MDETRHMVDKNFGLQAHIQLFGFVLLSFNSRKTSLFGKQARFQIGPIEWQENYWMPNRQKTSHGMVFWRRRDGSIWKHWNLTTLKERRRIKEWKKNNPDKV